MSTSWDTTVKCEVCQEIGHDWRDCPFLRGVSITEKPKSDWSGWGILFGFVGLVVTLLVKGIN